MSLARENIDRMEGYTPGEQPTDPDVIKLNTNENPYPPSPRVDECLAGIRGADLRRYPPAAADEFRVFAAGHHGVRPENIIPTNGGDELLRLAITTFVNPGQMIAFMKPSYSLYQELAHIQDCIPVQIPMAFDWGRPDNLKMQLATCKAKMCLLVNPHAPSGRLVDADYFYDIAKDYPGILVIDEAYVDFIDPSVSYDSIALVNELDNVLLLRTMSKGYSLAGLRFGYGIGSEALLDPMTRKTRDSYNTDFISQKLALAALGDQEYAKANWAKVRKTRGRLIEALRDIGLRTLESHSNFVLTFLPTVELAQMVYQRLKDEHGIYVRYWDAYRLRETLRITVGTDEENEALIKAFHAILDGVSLEEPRLSEMREIDYNY